MRALVSRSTGLFIFILQYCAALCVAAENLHLLARDVTRFEIAPDAQRVAYASWGESGVELRSVLLGSWFDRIAYKGPDPYGETWRMFSFSPDGQFLVYPVHELAPGPSRLMSLELTEPSGRSELLYDSSPYHGGPINWSVTSDSRYVVYLTPTELQELFAVPLQGPSTASWRLNSQFPDFGEVWNYVLSADGRSAFYSGDQVVRGEYGIWKARLEVPGSPPQQVSSMPPTSEPLPQCVHIGPGSIDPAGNALLHDCGFGWQSDLYASDARGNEQSLLLYDVHEAQFLNSYAVTPDGEWAVFELQNPPLDEVFRVPIGGPPSAMQLVTTDGPGILVPDSWSVSPDSSRLLYLRFAQWPYQRDLYSASLGEQAGGSVRLSPPTNALDGVVGYEVTRDSQSVVFAVFYELGSTVGYRSPVDGAGSPVPIWTDPCYLHQGRKWIELLGEGDMAVVRCARETYLFPSLSLVRIRAEPNLSLFPLLPPDLFLSYSGETTVDFAVTSDEEWLVFLARSDGNPYVLDLYARQLPLFYDGFESGTILNWGTMQDR